MKILEKLFLALKRLLSNAIVDFEDIAEDSPDFINNYVIKFKNFHFFQIRLINKAKM